MDMQKIAKEIGLFETAINVARVKKSADVVQKVGAAMPLPDENIEKRVKFVSEWLMDFGKSKYMFLSSEIALIESMAEFGGNSVEAIIVIPCDMDAEAKGRLISNLPHGLGVTVLEEPYFPEAFFPGNGMVVACGYTSGERAMVLPHTYRMVEHYSGFLGKTVFVPYVELASATRYNGWMEIGQQRFITKWRSKS